jgi:ABC-type transport system substrate-binding protein
VLGNGRTLGDVPAKEWATLPELAECPMGFGPYTLACGDWEKGVNITYHASEHFVFGTPKTATIVIQIIQDTNQAVAQLLTGEVDIVLSETTTGQEQLLKDAEAEGKVTVYIEATPTWEHIDFNMFVK